MGVAVLSLVVAIGFGEETDECSTSTGTTIDGPVVGWDKTVTRLSPASVSRPDVERLMCVGGDVVICVGSSSGRHVPSSRYKQYRGSEAIGDRD